MKIIVMGASGMLGHLLYSEFKKNHQVWGTVRSKKWHPDLLEGYDLKNLVKVEKLISELKPDFVINCIGIIKQLNESKNKILSLEINSLWPQQLAEICLRHNSKMIHFSTDCVFSGKQGNYTESDLTDARDIYGLTKLLGEVDYDHTLTLRTSIIGHELDSHVSLVEWFLSQENECQGFTEAIYSGFPTIEIAHFIENFIFKKFISGVYHLSSEPISKYELLKLIAKEYKKDIRIIPNDSLKIDRSMKSELLRKKLNFTPDSWPEMVKEMYQYFKKSDLYKKDK